MSLLGDRFSNLEAEIDPENQQLQNTPLQFNSSDPLPNALENSIADNSVPTLPHSPISDDRERDSSEDTEVLNL